MKRKVVLATKNVPSYEVYHALKLGYIKDKSFVGEEIERWAQENPVKAAQAVADFLNGPKGWDEFSARDFLEIKRPPIAVGSTFHRKEEPEIHWGPIEMMLGLEVEDTWEARDLKREKRLMMYGEL